MQLQLSPRHIWPWYKWAASSAPKRPVTRSTKPAAEQRQLLHARHHRQEEEEDEHQNQQQFEPWKPPPFKIGDVRAAIPSHCWEKNVWLSMSYVLRDAVAVALLALAAGHLGSWFFWPLYWLAQGTLFWAIFVLGHDCGHGSFSNSVWLNNLVGHLLHSCILVPYHGWRISHRTHHQNHGNVDMNHGTRKKNRVLYVARDGVEEKAMKKILTAMFDKWVPQLTSILIGCQPSSLMTLLTEKTYREMDATSRKLRFRFPFPLFAFPAYLWRRSPGKEGSHFHPGSSLFRANERQDVVVSTLCWSAMVALLLSLAGVYGPVPFLKLYGVPYLVFVLWLDLVTYLHHHGHGQKLPWYRGKEWSYLRGGLTTVDRDYGWINNIHHDIGTHVIHHLFPQIPHYNLVEATRAAKPVLGEYYREPEKSGPLPAHLFGVLLRSLRVDHFVSDEGDVVFYQTDPQLHKELLRQKAC